MKWSFTELSLGEAAAILAVAAAIGAGIGALMSAGDVPIESFNETHATQCRYLHRLPVGRKNRIAITLACTTDTPITTYAQLMR